MPTYNIHKNYNKASDFHDSSNWLCYLGRTSTDPNSKNAASEGPMGPTGVDWYNTEGNRPLLTVDKDPWVEDPTKGVTNYYKACTDLKSYIQDDNDDDDQYINFKVKKEFITNRDYRKSFKLIPSNAGFGPESRFCLFCKTIFAAPAAFGRRRRPRGFAAQRRQRSSAAEGGRPIRHNDR